MSRLFANHMYLIIHAIVFICAFSSSVDAIEIKINNPNNGFTTKRIQNISGRIDGYANDTATLVVNGIPQNIILSNGVFNISIVVAPGNNVIEVIAGEAKERVSFYAKVPKKDIKVVLTWDTPTDVDLWVIDPKGIKCYYSSPSTETGGNLDIDVTTGYGPETFTMSNAIPGEYSVQVQYFDSKSAPVTRVNVYTVINEGTPGEKRTRFQFTMTKEHQVYHIANFHIEDN